MLKKKLLAASRMGGSIMTLPDERYRAVISAERLMADLLDPKRTPRVPQAIRNRARSVLRHYPSTWDMDRAAAECPHVFTKHLDPLYKMVKQHDMQQRLEEDVEQDLIANKQQQQQ